MKHGYGYLQQGAEGSECYISQCETVKGEELMYGGEIYVYDGWGSGGCATSKQCKFNICTLLVLLKKCPRMFSLKHKCTAFIFRLPFALVVVIIFVLCRGDDIVL